MQSAMVFLWHRSLRRTLVLKNEWQQLLTHIQQYFCKNV